MSPYLHADTISDRPAFTARRRGIFRSIASRAVVVIALSLMCLPFIAGVAAGKGGAVHTVKSSSATRQEAMARQVQTRIEGLEARGYVSLACTMHGTLLVDLHTGEKVLVNW